jgi:hypothetical protein
MSSTYGMRCDVYSTRCGVQARRVGRMEIGRMVRSGVGRGVMRDKGDHVHVLAFVLIARAHMTARVRTLALRNAVHHPSAVFVAGGPVGRCSGWRRRRGVGLTLGEGNAGVPWVIGTAGICGGEAELVSITLSWIGGSGYEGEGGREQRRRRSACEGPGLASGRDKREREKSGPTTDWQCVGGK